MSNNIEKKVASKVGGFFTEFWTFAAKGNAFQLAIAVVLGAAFGAIVNALVNNIITPFITLATGNVDFNSWGYVLRPAMTVGTTTKPALIVGYGPLLQSVINFIIVGLSIFIIFKLATSIGKRLKRQQDAGEVAPPEPPAEEKLLTEIRDLLKQQVNDSIK